MTAPTLSTGFLGAYSGVEFVNPGAVSSEPVASSSTESFNALLELLTGAAEQPTGPAGPMQAAPFNAVAMWWEDGPAPAAGNTMGPTGMDAPAVSPGPAGEVLYPDACAIFDSIPPKALSEMQIQSRPSTESSEEFVDAGDEMASGSVSAWLPPSEDGNGAAADAYSVAQLPADVPDAVPVPTSAVPQTAASTADGRNAVQCEALVPAQAEVKRTTAAEIKAPARLSECHGTFPGDAIEGDARPETDEEADGEETDRALIAATAIPQSMPEVSTPVRAHEGASFSERSMAASGEGRTHVKPAAPDAASGYAQPAPSEDHVAFSATLTDASQEPSADGDPRINAAAPRMAQTVPAVVMSDATRSEGQNVAAPHRSAAPPPLPTPAAMEPLAPPEHGSTAPRAAHDFRVAVEAGDRSPSRLEIRVSDRGGKIDVAVHSADPNTRSAVRSDLNDLVGRLERAGYNTEMHQPVQGGSARDAASAMERSFTTSETARDRSAQTWQPAAHDTSWSSDSDHRRREGQEPPPRRSPQARPQSPGRSFIDEFKR